MWGLRMCLKTRMLLAQALHTGGDTCPEAERLAHARQAGRAARLHAQVRGGPAGEPPGALVLVPLVLMAGKTESSPMHVLQAFKPHFGPAMAPRRAL